MCTPTIITAALLTAGSAAPYLAVASTVMTAKSQIDQGKFQAGTERYNARVAENQAQQTLNVGTEKENILRQQSAELLSKQRAQLGAAGVDIGSGSALQLQEDTIALGEADALRIRSTAEAESGSLMTQAELRKSQAGFAETAGMNKAFGTLLGGAANIADTGVADKWFKSNSSALSPA